MAKKLDLSKRKKVCPPPKAPVKFSHTCEIDGRTKVGSKAWYANNSPGAQRVDAIRSLHVLAGSHETAAAMVLHETQNNVNQTIDSVRTSTLARIVKKYDG